VSLADFVKVSEELYAILDSKSTEQVDAVIVNAVVQQLREAVGRSADGPSAYVSLHLCRIHRPRRRNFSWRGHWGVTPDPYGRCKPPEQCSGQKNKEISPFFVTNVFGHLGGEYCPLCSPGYAYVAYIGAELGRLGRQSPPLTAKSCGDDAASQSSSQEFCYADFLNQ